MTKILIFKFCIFALALSICTGCFFARIDVTEERASATLWTFCKDYTLNDPNSWFISSEANKWTVWTPYGKGETR